jgi:hypothetical protein
MENPDLTKVFQNYLVLTLKIPNLPLLIINQLKRLKLKIKKKKKNKNKKKVKIGVARWPPPP